MHPLTAAVVIGDGSVEQSDGSGIGRLAGEPKPAAFGVGLVVDHQVVGQGIDTTRAYIQPSSVAAGGCSDAGGFFFVVTLTFP